MKRRREKERREEERKKKRRIKEEEKFKEKRKVWICKEFWNGFLYGYLFGGLEYLFFCRILVWNSCLVWLWFSIEENLL